MSVGPSASRASVCALSTPLPPLALATPLAKGVASPRSSEWCRMGRKHVGTWQDGCPPGQTWVRPPPPSCEDPRQQESGHPVSASPSFSPGGLPVSPLRPSCRLSAPGAQLRRAALEERALSPPAGLRPPAAGPSRRLCPAGPGVPVCPALAARRLARVQWVLRVGRRAHPEGVPAPSLPAEPTLELQVSQVGPEVPACRVCFPSDATPARQPGELRSGSE